MKNEVVVFFSISVLVGCADLALYFLLMNMLPIMTAKAISFASATIASYFLNKSWTFNDIHAVTRRHIISYLIVTFLALAINLGINQAVLTLWPSSHLMSWWMASLVSGWFTFFGLKYGVFKRQ